MRKRLALLIGVVLVGLSGCTAKLPAVKPVAQVKDRGQGMFYALPKTRIAIQVAYGEYKPGKCFSIYGGSHVLPEIDKNKLNKFILNKGGCSIDTVTVPDTDNIYMIDLTGSAVQDMSFDLQYNEKNFFTKTTTNVTNNSLDIATKIFSGLAGIVEGAAGIGFKAKSSEAGPPSPSAPSWCKAMLNELDNIRQAKLDLVSGKGPGTAGNDLSTLKYRVDQITALENSYLDQFFTKSDEKIEVDFDPAGIKDEMIYYIGRFNEKPSGDSPFLLVKKFVDRDKKSMQADEVYVVISKIKDSFSRKIEAVPYKNGDDNSYYYRIPGEALVQLCKGSQVIAEKSVKIAQFGIITAMPRVHKGTTANLELTFDEDTGAIKELKLDSKSIDPAKIQAAMAVPQDVLKYVQDQQLNSLTQQQKVLDAKVQINKDKESLANPGAAQ